MDMLEQIIQLVTILFLLSMVCERIADFLKHYLSNSSFFKIGDTITKSAQNEIAEDKRYYRILKINVLCGIVTAAILKADLIKIFNNIKEPGKTIGWNSITEYYGWDYFFLPLGIILTGCFISFGSKFWHDLLDILLEIKNAKRAVTQSTQKQTQSQTESQQLNFNNLSPLDKDQVLKNVILSFSNMWSATITNYKRVDTGKKIIANKPTDDVCLRFYVESKEYKGKIASPVPEYIFYGGFKIPTDVVNDTGDLILHNWENPGNGSVPSSPGTSISRKNNTATGTISLKVKKKINGIEKFYALSCYHVLFDNEYSNGLNEVKTSSSIIGLSDVKIPGDNVKKTGMDIGKVGWGKVNEYVDAGVAELTNPSDITIDIDHIGQPVNSYTVIADDENILKVNFCGAKTGIVRDKVIKGCHASKDLNTPGGKVKFIDLIQIEKCSDFGDSGAPVIDEFNRLIGIIEGSDKDFTFIIPIQNIINQIKVNPILKLKI